MNSHVTRHTALKRTALVTAMTACLFAGSVLAQTAGDAPVPPPPAEPTKAQNLETVTVTGSRIRSADIETSQPVFTMDRQAIKATGLTNVDDILARMPSAGTPDITPQDSLASGTDVGGRYVNIRNLGSARTLVLVNGKRWSTSLTGLTDLSTIPVSMIDRIDVLKDGASSIYGSDAIGGVVNIITREKFDGAEANVYYGQNGRGDGQQKNADFTWGHSTAKSQLIVGASYQDTKPMYDSKRDLTVFPQGPRHPTAGLGLGPYGTITDPASGDSYVINHGPGITPDSANFADYHLADGRVADKYDTNLDTTFRAGSKLKNLFVQERYNLTDDIILRGTGSYTTRDSLGQLAGYPFQTAAGRGDGIFIDPNNAYNPFPGNPTEFLRRTVEQPRDTFSNAKLAHFDVGAEGYFQLGDKQWSWDADYNYSKTKIRQITTGNIYLPNAEKALGPTTTINGQIVCADAADRAAGCVPWNILAGPGATPQSVWNYVGAVGTARQSSQTDDITLNTTGGIFDLPAGTVNIAGGVEHRREKGKFTPDPDDSNGLTTNLASGPTKGSYIVNEAYLELDVPLLRDLPLAKELGLNVASRYSHYSNFGSTTNNKYTLRWKPFDDLLLRATYAEGFRAPTINDLDSGTGESFETFLDPCDTAFGAAATNPGVAARCAAAGVPANYRQLDQTNNPITSNGGGQTQTPFLSGSNPKLQPEKSITRTAGLVYSPHYVDGLNFTLDYYNVYIKNIISSVVASDILNFCYVQNNPDFCNRFQRDATGRITELNESLANLGTLKTEGYDFGIHYLMPETSFGKFRIASDSTYLVKFQEVSGPGATPSDTVGFMAGEDGLYRIRSNLQLDWDYKQFGASWTVRYYSGLKDTCFSNATPDEGGIVECNQPNYTNPSLGGFGVSQKGSVAFNDFQLRYTAPWNGSFTAGVNNVFNKKGPFYYSVITSGTGSPPYNPAFDIDRNFYLSYNQKF
jgi:iron complex outermembrane receptor protein